MNQPKSNSSSLVDSFKKKEFPRSILLVDDEPQQLQYLTMVLERGGFHVIKAESGRVALKMLQTASPDLILSDLNMPGLDGIEFCKEVYSIDSCLGIPFMIISAIHDNFFKTQAVDAGAIDYIFKPFSPEQLIKSIHDVFERIDLHSFIEVIFVKKDPSEILNNENIFRENGIIIKCTSCPLEAIESIHSKKWDMVVSDTKTNEMSAYDFCKILKNDVFKTIPFIISSKNISSSVYSEGLKFGVCDFWSESLSVYEIVANIKGIIRKKQDESFYPNGVYGKLDDLDSIAAAQKMFIKKQTGIMSLSNPFINGHIHFYNGLITDAYVNGYKGTEAFYVLMSIGRGGSYTIIKTNEPENGKITESPQNLFEFAKKLREEIQKIWTEPIIINKTFQYKAKGIKESFLKATNGKKNFRTIINELHIDPYHGFLILDKLMDSGIIVSPVKEHSLMEFNNVK